MTSTKDDIIRNINKKADIFAANIVFGIDHVICFSTDEEEELDVSNFSRSAQYVNLDLQPAKYSYFFYPHFGELFMQILSWGWNITFFTEYKAYHARKILRGYFKKFLVKYMPEPLKLIDKLFLYERIKVFGCQEFKIPYIEPELPTGYSIDYYFRIDTSLAGLDPTNVIIIDHDRRLVDCNNYPYIGLDENSSINFAIYFNMIIEMLENQQKTGFPKEFLEQDYSSMNNAYYIMGILCKMKDLLDAGRAHFLKQALDKVLHNRRYYKWRGKISQYDTPWYLSPLPSLNPISESLIKIGKKVLQEWGKNLSRFLTI